MAHSTVTNTLHQVVQAVLVSINEERERQQRVFRKLMRFTAFLCFPAMLGLALVSREFILLTIGDRWAGCVVMMQIICIGAAFLPLHALYQNLTISNGRSSLYMWCNIGQIILQLTLVLLLRHQSIEVIVGACSAFTILWLFVWQWTAHRMIGLRLIDMLKDTVPFLVVAVAVMAVTYLITSAISNLVLLLASRVVIAAALYYLTMRLLHAKVLEECIKMVRHKTIT